MLQDHVNTVKMCWCSFVQFSPATQPHLQQFKDIAFLSRNCTARTLEKLPSIDPPLRPRHVLKQPLPLVRQKQEPVGNSNASVKIERTTLPLAHPIPVSSKPAGDSRRGGLLCCAVPFRLGQSSGEANKGRQFGTNKKTVIRKTWS